MPSKVRETVSDKVPVPPSICIAVSFSSIYFPKSFLMIAPPIFLSIPCLVIGIPVFRLIFCFAYVISSALFQENVSPGIGVDFFAIV